MNTGVGSLSLLRGIFLTQELNQVSCIAGGFFISWAAREATEHSETILELKETARDNTVQEISQENNCHFKDGDWDPARFHDLPNVKYYSFRISIIYIY